MKYSGASPRASSRIGSFRLRRKAKLITTASCRDFAFAPLRGATACDKITAPSPYIPSLHLACIPVLDSTALRRCQK